MRVMSDEDDTDIFRLDLKKRLQLHVRTYRSEGMASFASSESSVRKASAPSS